MFAFRPTAARALERGWCILAFAELPQVLDQNLYADAAKHQSSADVGVASNRSAHFVSDSDPHHGHDEANAPYHYARIPDVDTHHGKTHTDSEGVLRPDEAVRVAVSRGYRHLLLADTNSIAAAHQSDATTLCLCVRHASVCVFSLYQAAVSMTL